MLKISGNIQTTIVTDSKGPAGTWTKIIIEGTDLVVVDEPVGDEDTVDTTESANYVEGVSGWKLDEGGSIMNPVIGDTLKIGSVFAEKIPVGAAPIGDDSPLRRHAVADTHLKDFLRKAEQSAPFVGTEPSLGDAISADKIVSGNIVGVEADSDRQHAWMLDITGDEALAYVGLCAMQRLAHKTATDAGWYVDPATGKQIERNFGEVVALMHSELSEALEADRKDLMDDKLPHRPGTEVEFADCLIRIFDTAAARGLDVAGAAIEKNRFNRDRADHKLANRNAEGGKKY